MLGAGLKSETISFPTGQTAKDSKVLQGNNPGPRRFQLLSYYPAAQKPGDVANNLILAGEAPTYWDEYGIRVDHNINSNTNGYFRYSYKQEAKQALPITGAPIRQAKAISGLTTAGECGLDSPGYSAPPSP